MNATRCTRRGSALALLATLAFSGTPALAQSPPPAGKMWLLEDPPLGHIQEVYGVELDDAWLEKTRLACLRTSGGTAAFVSPEGLVLTNHHVVRGFLSQMEHEGKNLGLHGYVARSREEELPLPGGGVRQLVHVEDVTDRIFDGIDLLGDFEEVGRALAERRQRVLAEGQSRFEGSIAELVTMYRGGRVHLYVYKGYPDVRIVFAPELGAGYFGGDTDNFRYPRFALDFALCRVYEDGEPVDSSDFCFGWSEGGPVEGDVVFSVGNPGSTDRLLTVAELEYRRDALYPARTEIMDDFLEALDAYAADHPEDEDRLRELAFGLANGHKSTVGKLQGLHDEARMAHRRAVEEDLRERLAALPELDEQYGFAWEEIELALEELEGVTERWWYQTPWYGQGRWVRPLQRALQLVEDFHPDFIDENRVSAPSTDLSYPFDPEVYAAHLDRGRQVLGAEDPVMQALLRGMEPEEAVHTLLAETRITSLAFENELRAGGWEAIEASDDPAIAAARVIYPAFVANVEEKALLEAVIAHNALLVGRATDAVEGPVVCPEATFSPRLSAGTVAGYTVEGRAIPASTRFEGLYERCAQFNDEGDFDLPDLWFARKEAVDLATPLNFVTTLDSTGGSSGSPIFDAQRRIVGVLFDGNEEGTENEFVFHDDTARSVIVHSEAILETLDAVYEAPHLVRELVGERGSH